MVQRMMGGSMTNKPREWFATFLIGSDDEKMIISSDESFIDKVFYKEKFKVIEAGPVLEKIRRLEDEFVKAKRMTDHIFEKNNVNWGQTFVKWDIMNEGLIAMDEMKSILESK